MTTPGALAGRSFLVTGGGSGIGFACAERLVADGAAVTICGRTEARLAEAADRIGAAFVVADVTDEDAVRRAVDAAAGTGKLDGCVASAGGGGMLAPLHQQSVEEFRRVLDVNVVGTFLTLKHATAAMLPHGRGAFVAISSIAGHLTHPNFGAYPVSKAGIDQLVRNAADEYGRHGLRFNAIRPGFTATELMNVIPTESSIYTSYVDNTPLGRVGQPEEVAELARFLLGPESGWLTGTVIDLDGGHSLRRGPDYSPFVPPT